MSPLTKYEMKSIFGILILMYMLIRGTKIVLIGQEMYELSAPENDNVTYTRNCLVIIHIFSFI